MTSRSRCKHFFIAFHNQINTNCSWKSFLARSLIELWAFPFPAAINGNICRKIIYRHHLGQQIARFVVFKCLATQGMRKRRRKRVLDVNSTSAKHKQDGIELHGRERAQKVGKISPERKNTLTASASATEKCDFVWVFVCCDLCAEDRESLIWQMENCQHTQRGDVGIWKLIGKLESQRHVERHSVADGKQPGNLKLFFSIIRLNSTAIIAHQIYHPTYVASFVLTQLAIEKENFKRKLRNCYGIFIRSKREQFSSPTRRSLRFSNSFLIFDWEPSWMKRFSCIFATHLR